MKKKIIYLLAEIGGMGGGGMAALLSEVFEDDPEAELPPDSDVAEDVDENGVIRLLVSAAGAIGPAGPGQEDDSATSTRLPKMKS